MAEDTRLELLTHAEAAALARKGAVVLIPTAAIEQHGPHLPLDTDAFLCTEVARAAAERAAAGPVLVAPTLALGVSEHHMAFAGTLALSPETFAAAVADVSRSLVRHGFGLQVIVNGHGGNTALLAALVQRLGFEENAAIAVVDYWSLASDAVAELRESPPGGMAHACEFETSLMLYLRPEAVRQELVAREIPEPRFRAERLDLFHRGAVTAHWKTHELSRSGVLGAPDLASAEKGRRFFEACVDGLASLIAEVRATGPPP